MVIIPLIINVVTALIPKNLTVILSIFSFISLCILIMGPIIEYKINGIKEIAALIQQKFDCYFFDLNLYDNVHDDEIEKYVNMYGDKKIDRKKNWHENHLQLEHTKGVYFSQKENITK